MLKSKRLLLSVIMAISLSLFAAFFSSTPVKAADSNYSINFESLWNNESYLIPDNINTRMGYDMGMHFIEIIPVGSEYYCYYIKNMDDYGNWQDTTFGVGLAITKDGINFNDKGYVLTPDSGVTYDSFPGVLYENGTFYLYTERGVFGVNTYEIELSTSTDGMNFTKQGIVLSPNVGTWDGRGIGTPNIIKKDSTYYLFYHGNDGVDMQTGVATATSPSGPFTKYLGNPVLPCGLTGSYDSGTAGRRGIIKEGSYYYMIYEGSTEGTYNEFSGSLWTLAFARSSDLFSWEKFSQNSVLPQKYSFGNDGPTFVTINGETWIYYRDSGGGNYTKRARLANETSGEGYDLLYEAENMTHLVGKAVTDGWNCNTTEHSSGYMISGPTASDLPSGEAIAIFKAKIDNNTLDNSNVMRIEVYDETSATTIASRDIKRQQFKMTNHLEFFILPFEYEKGHSIKFRAYYYDNSNLTIDRVLVKYGDTQVHGSRNFRTYEAEGTSFGHQVGRAVAGGWNANTTDNIGYMLYGPYVTDIDTGTRRHVNFMMKIDNNTYDNSDVAVIEVYNATKGIVMASKTIKRQEFRQANKYFGFDLFFNHTDTGNSLEFRVKYLKAASITVDRVIVDSADAANIASQATLTVSSQFTPGGEKANAVDNIKVDGLKEWASSGQLNPWIQLNWSSTRKINAVALYDRANLTDSCNAGTLYFSDGTSIAVTGISNDGAAKFIIFDEKNVTWVKFAVTNGSGLNVGLAEIEVFDSQETKVYQAESLSHQIGRADGDGWSASTSQDNAGYLIYGPYANDILSGTRIANFRMMIENNTSDDALVARIEVNDATTGTVISQFGITRKMFTATNTYQNFSLPFYTQMPGHSLEFRLYWTDNAYIKVDSITIKSK